MKITKELDYYSVTMENEKDIEDISNIFYPYTEWETIETYRKYLRCDRMEILEENDKSYSDFPIKVYNDGNGYDEFKNYYQHLKK